MKILIALDRSEYAEIVLEHGLEQAMQHPDAELHFITATADNDESDESFIWLHRLVADGLDEFSVPGRPVVLHVLQGRPATVVSELASELHVDLLVIGRFDVPSESDVILASVECPTLVVGLEGTALEPQCPDCERIRRDTNAEQLFCDRHTSDRLPDISIHVPPTGNLGSRLW
jgi:nucleotide-binding universal stress UspA family protein